MGRRECVLFVLFQLMKNSDLAQGIIMPNDTLLEILMSSKTWLDIHNAWNVKNHCKGDTCKKVP